MYIHIYIYIFTYIHKCKCNKYIYIYVYIYMYIYIYVYTYVYIYIYIYIYISIYIYIYIYAIIKPMCPPVITTMALCQVMHLETCASCAQVHELPQSRCLDNREETLFSWLHMYYYAHPAFVRFKHSAWLVFLCLEFTCDLLYILCI